MVFGFHVQAMLKKLMNYPSLFYKTLEQEFLKLTTFHVLHVEELSLTSKKLLQWLKKIQVI